MRGVLSRMAALGVRFVPAPMRDWFVRWMSPSFVIGAMVRIDNDQGQVLLVKPSYRNVWTLPGGVAGRGEDPFAIMERELFEETGLRCAIFSDPIVLFSKGDRVVDFIYHARLADGFSPADARVSGFEIEQVGWFDLADVPRLCGPFARKILSSGPEIGHPARLVFVDSLANPVSTAPGSQ